MVERIPLGKMLVGPDFYGCCNTGMAPALLHSRVLRDHPKLNQGFRFAIGPHVLLDDAVQRLLLGRVPAGQAFVEYLNGRERVTFAKTLKTARKRYAFLCAEMNTINAATRRKHQRLRVRAANGDLAAVAALIDY